MNRVNEINKAAQEYCKKNIPELYMRPTNETAFEAGAEYADKHPSRKLMIKKQMEELRREYIFPVHLNHAEMIDCSYLSTKKSKSRAGSTPYASKRKKKRKKRN